jgi:hypothetical protein
MVDGLEKVENCAWQWEISWKFRGFFEEKKPESCLGQ